MKKVQVKIEIIHEIEVDDNYDKNLLMWSLNENQCFQNTLNQLQTVIGDEEDTCSCNSLNYTFTFIKEL
jgi:hypothetical protein